jgi:hypothetical protein
MTLGAIGGRTDCRGRGGLGQREMAMTGATGPQKCQMQSAQTYFALMFCSLGIAMMLIAHYQKVNYDLRKVPMISSMAKHVVGLLLIIIAVLVFLSQFIVRR